MDIKIGAVAVLYYTELKEYLSTTKSFIDEIDKLIIVDNSDNPDDNLAFYQEKIMDTKIDYHHFYSNIGIAGALNYGMNALGNQNYKWILTMNQDSILVSSLSPYVDFIRSNPGNGKIAALSPAYEIYGTVSPQNREPFLKVKVEQSGMLINYDIFKNTGGFQDKYFIDYVDYAYCMELKRKHCLIYCVPEVIFRHNPGELKRSKIFKYPFKSQSPVRYYYRYRNGLDYCIKYRDWRQMVILLKGLVVAGCFEDKKIKNISYILKGSKDFFRRKWGKIK